ncbi:hypothetical protein [Sulfitobacter sp. CW3]|uniref:hypothetical protein n=1 Tax=Sulfitobacter sp. CW3 TaxID=2861965 RepID=UPI001C5E5A47|nr:hypothetical protein [Sulfitobacter sp. CW3]MBW4962168.1 hypothetical protein [Sulfitobacter sp. CW3]
MTIASNLVKADRLLEKLRAAQPADPLADLTTDQRHHYEQWWDRFRAQHSAQPDALYEAVINYSKWTPNDWLACQIITNDMSIIDVQTLYTDQLGKRQ